MAVSLKLPLMSVDDADLVRVAECSEAPEARLHDLDAIANA